jgi:hypothetical protein
LSHLLLRLGLGQSLCLNLSQSPIPSLCLNLSLSLRPSLFLSLSLGPSLGLHLSLSLGQGEGMVSSGKVAVVGQGLTTRPYAPHAHPGEHLHVGTYSTYGRR